MAGEDPDATSDSASRLTILSSVVERAWHSDRTGQSKTENRAIINSRILKAVDVEAFAESQQYTTLHKIVLGLSSLDLARQLEASTATIDDPDSRGRTALWWASAVGEEQLVRLLLAHGASIHIGSKPSHGALHIARNVAVLELLLKYGAEVDSRDENGRTPLHCCAYRGSERGSPLDLVIHLIEAGADINARSAAGHTPLHYATMYGFDEHMAILLRKGADIESRKYDGYTPLMLAILCNQQKAVKLLLENGADYKALALDGRTSLHLAATNGNVATLKCLSSAALDGCDINQIDQRGFTARQLFQQRNDRTEVLQKAFENLLRSVQAAQVGKIGTGDADEDEDTEDFSDAMEVLSSDEIG
jgi:ankyrin repeat protein